MNIQKLKTDASALMSKIFGVGKDSVIPLAILWLLDFKGIQQGTEIGKELATTGWSGARSAANGIITRVVVMFALTALSAQLMYWTGWSFMQFMFTTMLIATGVYVSTLVFLIAVAHNAYASTDDSKSALKDVSDSIKHLFVWVCFFIVVTFIAEPWQNSLRSYGIFIVTTLALFTLTTRTRGVMRAMMSSVMSVCLAVTFVVILGPAIGLDVKSENSSMARGTRGILEAGGNLYAKIGEVLGEEVGLMWVLSDEEHLMNFNRDDTLNGEDLTMLQDVVADSTLRTTVQLGGRTRVLGDFNGDGKVDDTDVKLFDRYLNKNGVGPTDLKSGSHSAPAKQASTTVSNTNQIPSSKKLASVPVVSGPVRTSVPGSRSINRVMTANSSREFTVTVDSIVAISGGKSEIHFSYATQKSGPHRLMPGSSSNLTYVSVTNKRKHFFKLEAEECHIEIPGWNTYTEISFDTEPRTLNKGQKIRAFIVLNGQVPTNALSAQFSLTDNLTGRFTASLFRS